MTFEEVDTKIKQLAAQKGGTGDVIKFQTDEGNIVIDRDGTVTNDDRESDVTIGISAKDLGKLMTGDLNPMTALMFGKIKITGDMSLAMKLQSLF
ncbi:sterol-binding protein [Siphonobacter sp. BAB-5385]|uniref:Sterol-binding protein n=1 Tax=Siphonobacter curvatus TaxID=2094562 RepID=A0A2S7IPQ9_9BACT|nr:MULTISPECIES: SCP2 sterol-binding domain-containing protein [Siphonobacter]OZI09573.1 sterol-binding protein [Siphonobacter sp. BAB-5385]PMD99157.1 sterol-binding protein [Siphonobacter sp. BAB-5405]PQA59704.1 sterol-binding protein [Siphonobacter curvatus]